MLDNRPSAGINLRELIECVAGCLPSSRPATQDIRFLGAGKAARVTRAEEARDREVAAYEAALAVASEITLDDVLRRLVVEARNLVGSDGAVLTLTNDDDTIERAVAVSGASTSEPELSVDGRWSATTLKPGTPLSIKNARSVLEDPGSPISSLIGIPIELTAPWRGNLFVIHLSDGERFLGSDVRLLETLGRHAGPSIMRSFAHQAMEFDKEQTRAELLQFRTILDTLPAGVMVVLPPDGRIEWCNQTAVRLMFGDDVPASTIPQINRDFRWLGDDGAELPRSMHPGMRALRGERIPNRALTLQAANGNRTPMRVQSVPIAAEEGKVARAVVMFFDVSRERAAEQVKDDFLSLISHEFRTPLTAIHGGAHLLSQQGKSLDEETRAELLKDIGEESSRLDRMLANLLRVAEIMAGRFQASTEPILVGPFVQPIIDDFSLQAPQHRLTLEVEPGVVPAEGDPELLLQILRNLYENAVKYTPGGGEIRTVIRRCCDWVSVEVIDNGLGIAHDHVPHVFERFRRPGADPTVRGMGLGLYLSRLLVDAQGGRIHAASAGPGQGATFVVELPVVADLDIDVEEALGAEHA